jgi:cytochrome c553
LYFEPDLFKSDLMTPTTLRRARAATFLIGALALAACQPHAPAPKGLDHGVAWAFPGAGAAAPEPSASTAQHLPNLDAAFTQGQIDDLFHAVDWRPAEHPAAPAAITTGRQPDAMACGYCHLMTGAGRPENAALAGLPADYIVRQVTELRSGDRISPSADWNPAALMRQTAHGVSDADLAAAAGYFAGLPFSGHVQVVETARAPKAVAADFVYRFDDKAAPEPLGARILEGPTDWNRFELRDPDAAYVAYIPPGSLARGAALAKRGDSQARPCVSCHGPALTGAPGVPAIAGRSPTYIFRQLYAFKAGARNGTLAEPMKSVVGQLSTADMIALAAYVGSQPSR